MRSLAPSLDIVNESQAQDTRAWLTSPGQRVVTYRPILKLDAAGYAWLHPASAARRNDASTTIMASDDR
jgi:hypothetical protein